MSSSTGNRKRRASTVLLQRYANKRPPPPSSSTPDEQTLNSQVQNSQSDLFTNEGPLKSAEYALIGFGKVYTSDITLQRTLGSPQRPIYPAHAQNLADLMLNKTIGIRRLEHVNRIIVSAPKSVTTQWESSKGVNISPDSITDITDFYKTTHCRFEVEDGQHRLAALERVINSIAENRDDLSDTWKQKQLWWTAYIYDSETIKLWDLEMLRMNVSSHNKPDTEADVWIKLDSMQSQAKAMASEETMKAKWDDLGTRILALNTVPRRFKEIYDGRWAPVVRRLLRYPAYYEGFYSNALARVNVQRSRFFWKNFFTELECLLEAATAGRPEVLTAETLQTLRTIKLPRSATKVEQLYGINIGSKAPLCRGSTLFRQLSDEEYRASATRLSSAGISVAFSTWEEIAKCSTRFADLVDSVCYHICKWVDPTSMSEGQGCRRKRSVEEVWESCLPDATGNKRACAESFGGQVVGVLRKWEKVFRKNENRPYLNRNSIDNDTRLYRERFSCPAWLELLELTVDVFGALHHPHVYGFNDSNEIETIHIYDAADMALYLTRTVKRIYPVELQPPPDKRALSDLQGRLTLVLHRWHISFTQNTHGGEKQAGTGAGLLAPSVARLSETINTIPRSPSSQPDTLSQESEPVIRQSQSDPNIRAEYRNQVIDSPLLVASSPVVPETMLTLNPRTSEEQTPEGNWDNVFEYNNSVPVDVSDMGDESGSLITQTKGFSFTSDLINSTFSVSPFYESDRELHDSPSL